MGEYPIQIFGGHSQGKSLHAHRLASGQGLVVICPECGHEMSCHNGKSCSKCWLNVRYGNGDPRRQTTKCA